MNKIEYGTEFLDQLKDSVHDLYDENKELKKEIERLKELCNKYEEEHKTTFEEWKKDIQANKKAIEYVEDENIDVTTIRFNDIQDVKKDLLEILKNVNRGV